MYCCFSAATLLGQRATILRYTYIAYLAFLRFVMLRVECLNKTGNVRINVILRRGYVTVFAVQNGYILHVLSVCL